MRIIKLSPSDEDMKDLEKVQDYFERKLQRRKPRGQFLLTKGRISKKGISPGEMIIFSYNTEIVYLALSDSDRQDTTGPESIKYPHYFCIDTETIVKGRGTLSNLEHRLNQHDGSNKNIVHTQGWPKFKDTPGMKLIWEQFKSQ